MTAPDEVNGLQRKEKESVSFTDEEVEFLAGSKLARLATSSSAKNQPHVVPVAYEFDGKYFYFGGWNLRQSLKFRNLVENKRVALVIDDLVSSRPWVPRGVEVRGIAEVVVNEEGLYVRITPFRKISWGLNRKVRQDY